MALPLDALGTVVQGSSRRNSSGGGIKGTRNRCLRQRFRIRIPRNGIRMGPAGRGIPRPAPLEELEN